MISPLPRLPAALLLSAVAVAVAGCSVLVGAARTFEPGVETQPGPGLVLLVGDPPLAARPLTIEFVTADGTVYDERRVELKTGDTISASTFGLPGQHFVRVNMTVCDGSFTLESDRTTTVVLTFPGTNCAIATKSVKPT